MTLILFLFLGINKVLAVDFDKVSVRLDRSQVNQSPLPVLIQINTEMIEIEDKLRIIVAGAWEIDDTIIVSTSGLPSGLIPLPSIGNGVKTEAQTIDFPIGDLVAGVDWENYRN